MQKKVWFKNKRGERLVGTAHIPKTKEKWPTVILAHGFGGVRSERGMFVDVAKALYKAEFCVWRFDFVGCGESSGSFVEMTLSKEVRELRDIIRFVKKQPNVDRDRVGLLGMSFGGNTAIALNPLVKAMVIMSSGAKPYDYLVYLFSPGFNPQGVSICRGRRSGKIKKIGPALWQDLERYNFSKLARKIKVPILFVYGKKDHIIPFKGIREYYKNVKGIKRLKVIKNANHGFRDQPMRRQMVKEVTNWFKKYL